MLAIEIVEELEPVYPGRRSYWEKSVLLARLRSALVTIFVVVGALGLGCAGAEASPKGEAANKAKAAGQSPVVLELFTSQGCSSCPSADVLLPKLQSLTGRPIVALSFHVDYWNYIGWNDPFSSSAATKRQRQYAKRISKKRIYTPQLVVQGEAHVVGSNRSAATKKIAGAKKLGPLKLKASRASGALSVSVTGARPGATVLVALAHPSFDTHVTRGENSGKTLHNEFVVRAFVEELASSETTVLNLAIPEGRSRLEGWQLVALAQDGNAGVMEAVGTLLL